jgi:diphthine-ammonia ligase
VHVLGEGGEFETLVVDAPHMDRRIEIDADPVWEGTRGHLDITDARLA